MNSPRPLRPVVLLAWTGLLLAACGSPTAPPGAGSASPSASPPASAEGAGSITRVALTYDGGVLVLDGTTLDVVADLPLAGFNRVNPAGDGRHVMVSTTGGFRVLDAAGQPNAGGPTLTDLVFTADAPGHVVRHGGRTVLFADGTGEITAFDSDALDGDAKPGVKVTASEEAHHGVAIELSDGTLLSTLGDAEGRTGVRVLDPSGAEIARNEQCPSVHGEGAAQGEIVVFGCSDGVLMYSAASSPKCRPRMPTAARETSTSARPHRSSWVTTTPTRTAKATCCRNWR